MPVSKPIKIYPQDLQPNIGLGVSIPFNQPGVFKSTFLTKDAIRNNLLNYFLTYEGERYMNPLFGGGLRKFLFEQITDGNTEFLEQNVQTKIQQKFPDIIVEELDVLGDEELHEMKIILKYSIEDTDMVDTITLEYNQ
jgi:phage baseplate assembly protein W